MNIAFFEGRARENGAKGGITEVLGCFFKALVDSGDPLARRPVGAPRRPRRRPAAWRAAAAAPSRPRPGPGPAAPGPAPAPAAASARGGGLFRDWRGAASARAGM